MDTSTKPIMSVKAIVTRVCVTLRDRKLGEEDAMGVVTLLDQLCQGDQSTSIPWITRYSYYCFNKMCINRVSVNTV